MEKIVAAAIKVVPIVSDGAPTPNDGIILSAPPPHKGPHRHHHLIPAGYIVKGNKVVLPQEQGFLTSTGRFVDRVEAMQIAVAADQLFDGQLKRVGYRELYSEHIWW
jgi:hypothetical protein